MPTQSVQDIFKRYDVRGVYPAELDEDVAFQIGQQFVAFLDAKTVAVGRDMRTSGVKLFEALAAGINSGGATVIDLGLVSTDALYFAVGKYQYDGGIMITASHNPAKYNGMKFTGKNAEALSLETGLSWIRDRVVPGRSAKERAGTVDTVGGGSAHEVTGGGGGIIQRDVLEDFAKHCLSFIDPTKIKPFKIAIDAGNGMGGMTVPAVFKHLPCDVVSLFFELDGTFPNHPANPLEPENIRDLQRAIKEHNCDLGVAFDGDADRMFILDENAKLVSGDIVTALVAANILKQRRGEKMLYNVVCSKTVEETIRKHSGVPRRAPVGHSLIKKIMRDEDIIFGGEHSGHFYFRDNWYADSGMIALLQCLQLFSECGTTVSESIRPIDTRFRSGEVNRTVSDAKAIVEKIVQHFSDAKIDYLDGVTIEYPTWWANIRSSNTEPLLRFNVEADSQGVMEEKLQTLLKFAD